MFRWCSVKIIFFFVTTIYGQQVIFPSLDGENLREEVVETFKPNFVQLYPKALKALYSDVYNDRDTVVTFFAKQRRYLPPMVYDPILFLDNRRHENGIQFTHIYPAIKGAAKTNGNAYSDLHNLIPVQKEIKEKGSNYIYGNPSKNKTSGILSKNHSGNTGNDDGINRITSRWKAEIDANKRLWVFEPPTSVKGDVARAIFYFYTMYNEESERSDPYYFATMKEDLCRWHQEDPVNEEEFERNKRRAKYQEGKPNPFVLDCSLANRLYCREYQSVCPLAANESLEIDGLRTSFRPQVQILPNPKRSNFILDISGIDPGAYGVKIYNSEGRLIMSTEEQLDYFNTIQLWNTKEGLYFIHLMDAESGHLFSDSFEIIQSG